MKTKAKVYKLFYSNPNLAQGEFFSGTSPKQAASKAMTRLFNLAHNSGLRITTFEIHLREVNGSKAVHCFTCTRELIKEYEPYPGELQDLQDMQESDTYISREDATDAVYCVHDNGGRPFKVIVKSGKIYLQENPMQECQSEASAEIDRDHCIMKIKDYLGYWTGFDSSQEQDHGNSILIKKSDNKYIFVGLEIYEFEVNNDTIIDFVSPIGNNDVPYPVAYGEEYVYFLLENKKVNTYHINLPMTPINTMDIYCEFYDIKSDLKLPLDSVNKIHERVFC